MVDLVAKRYVKALMSDKDTQVLQTIYNELETISTAYASEKFLLIVNSTEIEKEKKVDLMLSFVNHYCSTTTINLLKLLAEKKRLNILPDIVSDLNRKLAAITNTYEGVVYTNSLLSDDIMGQLNTQFAAKFNVNLKLTQSVCDYNGIKVDIDGLGVEIGFSKERLKSQMIEHILKAV
jgi:F-type H+-transporting ATPase subunit delta